MKKILLLILVCLTVNLFAAIDFTVNNYQVSIQGSPDYKLITKKIQKEECYKIKSENMGYSTNPGEPEIPSYTKLIALPNTGNYVIASVSYKYEIKKLDKPLIKMGWEENYKKNETAYSKDKWLPEEIVKIAKPSIMRNYRFTGVTIFPFKYNPAKNELKILKNIKIKLKLKLDESKSENSLNTKRDNLYSEEFYQIAKANILGIPDERSFGERNYLIIMDSSYHLGLIQSLINEKQKLGYHIYTASLEDIGDDKEQIKNYIQNAYDNWEYPPENVILFGDTSGGFTIPTYTVPATYPQYATDVSDLPYSLLEGEDYFPDIMLGRLSVRSLTQLGTVTQKIIQYQMDPPMESNWFSTAIMCADMGYPGGDYNDLTSAKETKEIVRQKLQSYGYDTVHTFYAPEDTNLQTLRSYINSGSSLINYRGFGGPAYWTALLLNQGYMITVDDIPFFSNGFKLPFVTSIVCGGGDFGNMDYPVCFGEMWVNTGTAANPKGAIGFIGPSEHDTKTWFNNANDQGIYQGFAYENLQKGAQMLLRGKMELYRNFPYGHDFGNSHVSDQFYFYVYNLLGDPALTVWSNMPKQVTSFEKIQDEEGNLRFNVQTEDNHPKDFIIAITNDTMLVAVGKTDLNGVVEIPANLSSGTYTATASKKGFLPISINFEVNNQDIEINNVTINPTILHNNSTFSTDVTVKNISTSDLTNLTFSSNSTDYITITSQPDNLENLSSNETYTYHIEGLVSNIWDNIIDTHLPVNISYDNGEKDFSIPVSLHTPSVNFNLENDFSLPSDTTNYAFNISVVNSSDSETGNINAVLTSLNSNVEVTQNSYQINNILSHQTENAVFNLNIPNIPSGFTGDFKLDLYSEAQKMAEFAFSVPIGEINPEDPTISYGYAAIESNDDSNYNNPNYDWVDIIPVTGLDGSIIPKQHINSTGYYTYLNLPFQVNYYGREYNSITFSSNGWISMGETTGNYFRNRIIPSGAGPSAMIAPFWDSMDISDAYYYYDTDNQRFIIEWYQTSPIYVENYYTFEVILYPSADNKFSDILFQYKNIDDLDSDGNYSTVGIESPDQMKGICMEFANIPANSAHQFENNYSILFTSVENLSLPLISATYDNFDFTMPVEQTRQFSIYFDNFNTFPIKISSSVSYDNDRDWIETNQDTLTINENGELDFTIDSRYLTAGNTYKAYIEILTEYQQLIVVPVSLHITLDASNNVIEPHTSLNKIYPNPFTALSSNKGKIKVSYYLSKKSDVKITVYNLKGENIKTLINEFETEGNHIIEWNGKNEQGNSVASGIYLYKLSLNGNAIATKKCVIIK